MLVALLVHFPSCLNKPKPNVTFPSPRDQNVEEFSSVLFRHKLN